MRRINGHYSLPDKRQVKFDFEIPSSWEELEPTQYGAIVLVLSYSKADKFTIAVSLLSLLCQKHFDVLENLHEEDLHSLISCTNFLLEEAPPVKNFFPELRIKKKEHAAPSPDLGNIGFGEWCFAFQFYTYYRQTREMVWLEKLIATLYRPIDPLQDPDSVDFSGDIRERFNENLIEKRALAVRDLHEKIKMGVFAWFTASVNGVMSFRRNVFPESPELPDGEAPEELPQENSRTWLSVFRELLGPKWGTTEQLKYTNALFVLDALEEQKIEYDAALKAAKA